MLRHFAVVLFGFLMIFGLNAKAGGSRSPPVKGRPGFDETCSAGRQALA